MSFWDALGKGLAVTGKGFITAALWASQHPEVLQTAATIATTIAQAQAAKQTQK